MFPPPVRGAAASVHPATGLRVRILPGERCSPPPVRGAAASLHPATGLRLRIPSVVQRLAYTDFYPDFLLVML